MKATEILEHLQKMQEGENNGQIQFDFLYSDLKIGKTVYHYKGELHLKIHRTTRSEPFQFYKPYSKLFDEKKIKNARENL